MHLRPRRSFHCRSRLPCDRYRPVGALVVLVAVQLSVLGLYLPPVFKIAAAINSAPDDHFTAGPDCRVTVSGSGRVGRAGGCPTIRAGIISPAGVQSSRLSISTPDDHFTAGPDCRVTVSARGRVSGAGGCPTIRAGIVSPASVQSAIAIVHPRRSFHCRSRLPCDSLGQWARWSCWWLSNYPCWDCISRRCSKRCRHQYPPQTIISLPVHTAVCPPRAVGALVVLVAVQLSVLGLYLPPVFKCRRHQSTPDDHFTAGPHCRVIVSARGRVGRAGGCPTIRAGIVSPASVQ